MTADFPELRFDERGLIPAVVQDENGQVLMLAYMSRESLSKTIEDRRTWFFSRSRQRLWLKGETSGHYQEVKTIRYDCDGDALLIEVRQIGQACHEGFYSCFHNQLLGEAGQRKGGSSLAKALEELAEVIAERRQTMPAGSYTAYLFSQGLDKIGKKVAEEAAETIIAAKNADPEEIRREAADLLYHLLVLLAATGVDLADVGEELLSRRR